jgi:hypothetical protein
MTILSSLSKQKQGILAICKNVRYLLKKPDSYEQNLASEEGDEKPIKNAEYKSEGVPVLPPLYSSSCLP